MPVCFGRACTGQGEGHAGSHHELVPGPACAAGCVFAPLWGSLGVPALCRHPAQVSSTGLVGLMSLHLRFGPAVGHAWSGKERQGPVLIRV